MGQLVYMALYLEHAIKYDLSEAHNLDKVGPGDMMSQLIQVNQSTTTKTLLVALQSEPLEHFYFGTVTGLLAKK